ncbi:MAG: T9SS type A sorting domain-containing protein, partial [Bacteroidetes bacterium]|nr:T9SS type A sorting domain-containing protein [Bacteroidota bacterium]
VSLTAPSGTIEDGSGTSEYSNFLNCTWIIEPSNVSTITLTFVEFGTQAVVDKVRIYDDLVSSTPIAQYHGSSIPAAVTSTTGLMRINFTTNSSITGTGWKANYTSTPSSGIESVDMGIFSVYPNPANKSLNVNLAEKDCTIELFDILGNKVFAAAELSGKVVIPVSAFSEGVYLMKVHSQGNQRTARISVIH